MKGNKPEVCTGLRYLWSWCDSITMGQGKAGTDRQDRVRGLRSRIKGPRHSVASLGSGWECQGRACGLSWCLTLSELSFSVASSEEERHIFSSPRTRDSTMAAICRTTNTVCEAHLQLVSNGFTNVAVDGIVDRKTWLSGPMTHKSFRPVRVPPYTYL